MLPRTGDHPSSWREQQRQHGRMPPAHGSRLANTTSRQLGSAGTGSSSSHLLCVPSPIMRCPSALIRPTTKVTKPGTNHHSHTRMLTQPLDCSTVGDPLFVRIPMFAQLSLLFLLSAAPFCSFTDGDKHSDRSVQRQLETLGGCQLLEPFFFEATVWLPQTKCAAQTRQSTCRLRILSGSKPRGNSMAG